MAPGLAGYIVRRLLWAIPVLFAISVIVFYMLRLAPGDPVDTLLGQRYQEEEAALIRKKYGYDRPIHV
ncbi:MAG: ABC transporter permease, partial [Dehalococcoidia bacterium]|nr:ABC transporter permease [Dehalococcoidia bacterium]